MKRLLLALLLTACAPPERATDPPLTQRATIYWVDPPPNAETRQEILDYLDRSERVYRARFGGGYVPVKNVVLEPGATLRDVNSFPTPLRGAQRGRTIWLPVGGFHPARSALHEFHHLTGKGDSLHHDPSWRVVEWLSLATPNPSLLP